MNFIDNNLGKILFITITSMVLALIYCAISPCWTPDSEEIIEIAHVGKCKVYNFDSIKSHRRYHGMFTTCKGSVSWQEYEGKVLKTKKIETTEHN